MQGWLSEWGRLISISLVSIFVFIFGVVYLMQPFIVEGQSMEPTLQNGNIMMIWKAPRSWARISKTQYLPKRWAVVVVKKPDGSGEHLVKRVIGLPGERVVIKSGKVLVINKDNPEGIDANQHKCCIQLQPTAGDIDITVPDGQIFVIGDNRAPAGSIDSRASLGSIPLDEVIGRVVLRVYPPKLLF